MCTHLVCALVPTAKLGGKSLLELGLSQLPVSQLETLTHQTNLESQCWELYVPQP